MASGINSRPSESGWAGPAADAGNSSSCAEQLFDALRRAPGIDRRFHAVQDTVEHFGDDRRRTFGDRASRTQQRHHGTLLSLAAVLPQDDTAASCESDHAAGREEMKPRGHFRRFMPPGRSRGATSAGGHGRTSATGYPVRADAGAIGLHLPVQLVEFAFEDFGALVQLELRKTFREDRLASDPVDGP